VIVGGGVGTGGTGVVGAVDVLTADGAAAVSVVRSASAGPRASGGTTCRGAGEAVPLVGPAARLELGAARGAMRTSRFGKACFVSRALVWVSEVVRASIWVTNGLPEAPGVWPRVIGSAGKPTLSQMA
jgi:hypothetical protein